MSDKRPIDANALPNYKCQVTATIGDKTGPAWMRFVFWEDIEKAPTIDDVEVVRCRKCKESEPLSVLDTDCLYCGVWDTAVHCNGYCYHGAKMDAKDMDVPTKDGGASDGV